MVSQQIQEAIERARRAPKPGEFGYADPRLEKELSERMKGKEWTYKEISKVLASPEYQRIVRAGGVGAAVGLPREELRRIQIAEQARLAAERARAEAERKAAEQRAIWLERERLAEERRIAGQLAKAPPLVVSAFEPPVWKKAPIERAAYEISAAERKLYQRREPGVFRELIGIPIGAGALGVGMISAVVHPIKTVKGVYGLITTPSAISELGVGIGKAIREKPGYATGYATAAYAGARGFTPIARGVRAVTKKISPRYIPPKKVGIEYTKWTEIVQKERELALAGRRIAITQVAPKPWFKIFRKEAIVRAAKPAEIKYPRRVAGELYTYWQPPTPVGKPVAPLGFGGIEPIKGTGLLYALRHPTKVKWTLFGKPAAEIKIVKAKIKPLPKRIMRMKPGIEAERAAAEYIMERPGRFYIPAEVKRVTRPLERAGLQEYQVALAPGTRLKAVSKRWTEIYGQKVKLVEAELLKAPKVIGEMPIAPSAAFKRLAEPITKVKPYYKPTPYYPLAKVARIGVVPRYKPIKYKAPTYYGPPYYKPVPYYKPEVYRAPKYPIYKAPYYPRAPYYPAVYYPVKYLPAKPPYYPMPIITAMPKPVPAFMPFPWAKRVKPISKLKLLPQPQAYVPSLPATVFQIKARRKPYVIPEEFQYGFFPGIRPIIRGRKRKRR